jgi:tRNA (guanine9-N1)-methyltransferase
MQDTDIARKRGSRRSPREECGKRLRKRKLERQRQKQKQHPKTMASRRLFVYTFTIADELLPLADAHGKSGTPRRIRHVLLPVTSVLDCDFDDLMTEKEWISLGAQLTRSYSDNHKAPFQVKFIISSWGGELQQRFGAVLLKHHENWRGIEFMEGDFVEAKVLMKENKKSKLAGVFAAEGEEKLRTVAPARSMPVAEVDENGKDGNIQSIQLRRIPQDPLMIRLP